MAAALPKTPLTTAFELNGMNSPVTRHTPAKLDARPSYGLVIRRSTLVIDLHRAVSEDAMPEFAFTELLPQGADETDYRLLTSDCVSEFGAGGRTFLQVDS